MYSLSGIPQVGHSVRGLLAFLGATLLGLGLGVGMTVSLVSFWRAQSGVENGPWRSNLTAGSSEADPTVRLVVALYGLLALNRSETIYFTATEDSTGAPFDGRCSYWIEGRDPDARWWSITTYGRDMFLIPNDANRYSVSQSSVARNMDGSFKARASLMPDTVNGIPTSKDGFVLMLRLYNPGKGVQDHPETTPLPKITKEACS